MASALCGCAAKTGTGSQSAKTKAQRHEKGTSHGESSFPRFPTIPAQKRRRKSRFNSSSPQAFRNKFSRLRIRLRFDFSRIYFTWLGAVGGPHAPLPLHLLDHSGGAIVSYPQSTLNHRD